MTPKCHKGSNQLAKSLVDARHGQAPGPPTQLAASLIEEMAPARRAAEASFQEKPGHHDPEIYSLLLAAPKPVLRFRKPLPRCADS
jgi:hypothetical protein